jgi:hypothetical protein
LAIATGTLWAVKTSGVDGNSPQGRLRATTLPAACPLIEHAFTSTWP